MCFAGEIGAGPVRVGAGNYAYGTVARGSTNGIRQSDYHLSAVHRYWLGVGADE